MDSARFHARAERAISAMPGGTMRPFWEPVRRQSMPHASIGQGEMPTAEMPSATRSTSRVRVSRAMLSLEEK